MNQYDTSLITSKQADCLLVGCCKNCALVVFYIPLLLFCSKPAFDKKSRRHVADLLDWNLGIRQLLTSYTINSASWANSVTGPKLSVCVPVCMHPGRQCCHSAASVFHQPSTACSTSLPSPHLRPPCLFSCQRHGLELSRISSGTQPTISAECFRHLLKTYLLPTWIFVDDLGFAVSVAC